MKIKYGYIELKQMENHAMQSLGSIFKIDRDFWHGQLAKIQKLLRAMV